MYIQYIQGLFQSRLGTADYAPVTSSLHYNDSLDTWTVICLTAAKFKPLIFSVSGFALSNVANIFIFMILDDKEPYLSSGGSSQCSQDSVMVPVLTQCDPVHIGTKFL
jgi:hypothetical protein